MNAIIDLLGRLFLATIFLYDAYDSVFYFKETKAKMTEYGLTWNQDMLLLGSIAFLIIGGLLVLFGYRSKLGAFMIALYWIPVTFIAHSWWNDPEPEKRVQAILFMNNLAIMGGLLLIIAHGSGEYSIKRLFATARVPGT